LTINSDLSSDSGARVNDSLTSDPERFEVDQENMPLSGLLQQWAARSLNNQSDSVH